MSEIELYQPNKKFGEAIMKAARAKEKQQLSEAATDRILAEMQGIRTAENTIEKSAKLIRRHEERISALQAGEFSYDYKGQIIFNDPILAGWENI
jgi:hypothetical protein